jgi:hypothetical protein
MGDHRLPRIGNFSGRTIEHKHHLTEVADIILRLQDLELEGQDTNSLSKDSHGVLTAFDHASTHGGWWHRLSAHRVKPIKGVD